MWIITTVGCVNNIAKELANKFDFDGMTLTEALKKTFENRNHNFTIEQFEQMLEFDSDDAMQKKWKAFIKKINTKTDDFETVLKTIKLFLAKPFLSAVENKKFVITQHLYSVKEHFFKLGFFNNNLSSLSL